MIKETDLSRRLLAIADLVSPGMRVADIGTDHAYVPVWLVQTGRAPEAIAMDVNEGPLLHARTAIRRAGLEAKIQARLSDGLKELKPGEADSLVIAGMGGALTIRILSDGVDKLEQVKELILGPQSEIADVRRYLRQIGFYICEEKMVLEDGKYYALIKARPGRSKIAGEDIGEDIREAAEKISGKDTGEDIREAAEKIFGKDAGTELFETAETSIGVNAGAEKGETAEIQYREDLYGPCLLRNADPILRSYLEKELRVREQILEQLKSSPGAAQRREEVTVQAARIRKILAQWPGNQKTSET